MKKKTEMQNPLEDETYKSKWEKLNISQLKNHK